LELKLTAKAIKICKITGVAFKPTYDTNTDDWIQQKAKPNGKPQRKKFIKSALPPITPSMKKALNEIEPMIPADHVLGQAQMARFRELKVSEKVE